MNFIYCENLNYFHVQINFLCFEKILDEIEIIVFASIEEENVLVYIIWEKDEIMIFKTR